MQRLYGNPRLSPLPSRLFPKTREVERRFWSGQGPRRQRHGAAATHRWRRPHGSGTSLVPSHVQRPSPLQPATLASRPSPLASSPLASPLSPLPSRLSPLASPLSPLPSRLTYIRSKIAAMPCPPPMHMVTQA